MTDSLAKRSVLQPGGYRDITPADLAQAGYPGRLIDVREPAEFTGELGHLPKAELVPLATLAAAAASWSRDAELILICRSGNRSARAAQLLSSMGFRKLYNLSGGMQAHNAAGLPITRS